MDGLKGGSNSPAALPTKDTSITLQGELPNEFLQLLQLHEKLQVFPHQQERFLQKTIPKMPTTLSCNTIVCDATGKAPDTTKPSHDQKNTQPQRKLRGEQNQLPFKAATGKEGRSTWKL